MNAQFAANHPARKGGFLSDAQSENESRIERYRRYMVESTSPEARRVWYRLMSDGIRARAPEVVLEMEHRRGLR